MRPLLLAAAIAAALCASPVRADQVTVFAAASLRDALEEISAAFAEETGHTAVVSVAGSSALARQIQAGAPADVFIPASVPWMDAVEADGLLLPGTRVDLVGNSLVLVASDPEAEAVEIGQGFDLAGLLGDGRLAMALVDAVPAGIYGKAALESLGVWEAVSPRVAQADNVRAALALVAAGEAPYGIVYSTDARAEDGVTVVGAFPANTHPPVVYPAAVLADAGPAATAFMDFLRGPEARAAFERQGFTVLE